MEAHPGMRHLNILICFLILNCYLNDLTTFGSTSIRGFEHPTKNKKLVFPKDHGRHDAFAFEWWYLTGHLFGPSDDKRYGTQLTVFRISARGKQNRRQYGGQIFIHQGLTNLSDKKFLHASYSIPASSSAVSISLNKLEHSGPGFSMQFNDKTQVMKLANANHLDTFGHLQINALLQATTPLVLHGKDGFSQKSMCEKCATYYSSFPRLEGSVDLVLAGQNPEKLQGRFWYDHEFGSQILDNGLVGWDWFGIQLPDNGFLMVFQIRDGTQKPQFRSGTLRTPLGETSSLSNEQIVLEPLEWWLSPKTGSRYPISWKGKVEGFAALTVKSDLAAQEVYAQKSYLPVYYEGTASVFSGGNRIGDAYIEMNGYNKNTFSKAMR